ncbi:MAG: acetyltransferase [Mesonia sp.]|uniref:acetyltransferase n=1 Tax=Mesonia sp. TaxID=1960830 RepID=UPI003F9C07D0
MEKKRKISIYGASGHGKVVMDILTSTVVYELAYVFDDDETLQSFKKLKVESATEVEKLQEFPIVFTIGDNKIRKKIVENTKHITAPPMIHIAAVTSASAILGEGSVVMAGAVINADAHLKKHVIINTGAVVEHDCLLEDYVHISPNAALAGNVHVGEGSHIGIGAQVIQGIKIGKWCSIGAGAVIIKDVPNGATVVGNPGRILKS